MPINMTDYKMIVHERVYNVLQIEMIFHIDKDESRKNLKQPSSIYAVYIDEDGEIKIMEDEAWCFQFVRRSRERGNES